MVIYDKPSLDTYPLVSNQGWKRKYRQCKAEVVFGVNSRNCSGNGICKMFPRGSMSELKKWIHYGKIVLWADREENLLINITKASLKHSTLQKFFDLEYFLIEEQFYLPSFVTEELSIKRKMLKAGSYHTFHFADSIWIICPNT